MIENEIKVNNSIIYGPNWYIIPSNIEEREEIRKIQRTKHSNEKECIYCHQKFNYGYSSLKSCMACHIFVKCNICGNYFELNFDNYSGTDQKRINYAIFSKSKLILYCSKECKTEGTKIGLKKFHEENPNAAKEWVEHSKNIKFCTICNKDTIHRGNDCTVCHGKHAIKEMQRYAEEHPEEEKDHRQKCAENLNNWWNERPEERTENAINNIYKWNNSNEGKEFNKNNCAKIGLIYGGNGDKNKKKIKFCNCEKCNKITPHIYRNNKYICEVCLGYKIYDEITNSFIMIDKYNELKEERENDIYYKNLIKSYNLNPNYLQSYKTISKRENITLEECILNESIKENNKKYKINKIINEIVKKENFSKEELQYIISNINYNSLNFEQILLEKIELQNKYKILNKYEFDNKFIYKFNKKCKILNRCFEEIVKNERNKIDKDNEYYNKCIFILKENNFNISELNKFKNKADKNNILFEECVKKERKRLNLIEKDLKIISKKGFVEKDLNRLKRKANERNQSLKEYIDCLIWCEHCQRYEIPEFNSRPEHWLFYKSITKNWIKNNNEEFENIYYIIDFKNNIDNSKPICGIYLWRIDNIPYYEGKSYDILS